MDGRAIGAGALGEAGLRQLASETDGPRPGGIEPGNRERPSRDERASVATGGARMLRPARP